MAAKKPLQGALPAAGIVEPTPVQLEAIPHILRGADVAVQSYTGSGKVKLLMQRRDIHIVLGAPQHVGRVAFHCIYAGMHSSTASRNNCRRSTYHPTAC